VIVVTGGCGFIGSNLVERLINEGYDVTVYDNLHTGRTTNLKNLPVDLCVKPYHTLPIHVRKAEVIFHLGIPSSSPMYRKYPTLVGETIKDAIQIFEYSKKAGCPVIYASSSSIYNGNPVPYKEDMPIYVTDYYTECRYAIERLAELYFYLHRVHSVGLRLFSVYGRRDEHKGRYANIVTQFLLNIRKGNSPIIYGDGSQTRDFIYIDDVVEAFILAWKGNFECQIFNVGTGVSTTFNQTVNLINKTLGTNVKPTYVKNPIKNYVHHTLADTSYTETWLKFRAKTPLERGVQLLAEYLEDTKT